MGDENESLSWDLEEMIKTDGPAGAAAAAPPSEPLPSGGHEAPAQPVKEPVQEPVLGSVQDPAQADQSGAATAAGEQKTDEQVDPKASTNLARVRQWGEGLERDIEGMYKPVHGKVEEWGGLEVVQAIAEPLLAPEFDGARVLDAVETERGRDAYEQLAVAMYRRQPDDFARFLFAQPDAIHDPQIRGQVEAFLEYRRTGGQAPQAARDGQSRTPVSSPPPTGATTRGGGYAPARPAGEVDLFSASIPQADLDAAVLPDDVREEIEARRALDPVLQQIRADLDELKSLREKEEREREKSKEEKEQERQRAADEVINSRVSRVEGELDSVAEAILSKTNFSTSPDEEQKAADNQVIRTRILAAAREALRGDAAAAAAFRNVAESYFRKGDRIAVRGDLRELKEAFRRAIGEQVQFESRRLGLQVRHEEQVREAASNRTVIAGSGGAPPLQSPPQQSKDLWDLGQMTAEGSRIGAPR